VQNTTDNPELGRQVVAYLRHRNFRNVYLVPHIPLELEETKIVVGDRQLETAKHLKNILGFGNFEPESAWSPQELVLQLGEDALYLPTNYRSYD
jgi:polyisoprenyl-teichoic acid--peptidoglycan teichoic acid transferase